MHTTTYVQNSHTFRGLWTKGLDAPVGAPTNGIDEDRLPYPLSTASPLLVAGGYTRPYASSSADYAEACYNKIKLSNNNNIY